MKKILLMIAFGAILLNPVFSQVQSVYMKSAVSLVDSAKITDTVVTNNQTDTFYLRHLTADDTAFTFPNYSLYTMKIGSGEYVHYLIDPVVTTGKSSFVKTEVSDDSLFTKILASRMLMVKPKFKVTPASLAVIHKKIYSKAATMALSFGIGNADSAEISRMAYLDSLHLYKAGKPVTWKKFQNGTLIDSAAGLESDKQYYFVYRIDNFSGLGIKEEKVSFRTLQVNKKPWIAKQADSSKTSVNSITYSGRAIGYGLSGTIFARYGKNGTLTNQSASLPITGIGEEIYTNILNNLDQNEDYLIRTYVQTSLGMDSFDFTAKTNGQNGTTFTITPHANGDLGYIRASFAYTIAGGGQISRGVFTDSTGAVTVENTTRTDTYSGTGIIYDDFFVPPGTYWVGGWGHSNTGEFILPSTKLAKVIVPYVATGINKTKKLSLVVYPNPTTDYLTINTEPFIGESIEIFDNTGRLIRTEKVTDNQTSIDVRDVVPGIYTLKIGANSSKFSKVN